MTHYRRYDMSDLKQQLKMRRLMLGLTQREVGERVGVSQGRIADMESERYEPTLSTWFIWAGALGLSMHIQFKEMENDAVDDRPGEGRDLLEPEHRTEDSSLPADDGLLRPPAEAGDPQQGAASA